MTKEDRSISAALLALIVLQTIMLTALYAGIPPHPPVSTPLFGIAPFIGAAIAAAGVAMIMRPASTRTGQVLSGLAMLLALVSFGPQKYFDAQFALIWPAVVCGQVAAVCILYQIVLGRLGNRVDADALTANGRKTS